MALDIDERHLLRLGHGEEELETEKDFSRLERETTLAHFGIRGIICSCIFLDLLIPRIFTLSNLWSFSEFTLGLRD